MYFPTNVTQRQRLHSLQFLLAQRNAFTTNVTPRDRYYIKHAPASGSLSIYRARASPVAASRSSAVTPILLSPFLFRSISSLRSFVCLLDLLQPRSHTRGLYKHRNIQTHIVLFIIFCFFASSLATCILLFITRDATLI